MIFKKVELAKIERDAPEAYQSLAKFYQTHGTASFYFLCHVALPLFFRLDWLHHLWANFRGDIAQKIRQDVPYHTIADVLQTPFLATVGKETYELENTVRDFLLSELESEFGEAHLHKLATFLYQYADKCVPKGYEQEAYHLSAWSVKNPQEATRIVADSLQNLFNKPNPATDHAEHTRLLFVLQSIASPAQDKTPYNAIEKIAQRNYDLLNEEASQQKYPIVTQQQAGKNTIEFKVPHNILEGLKIQDRATPENENIIPEAIQMIEKMFGAMEEVSIESIGDKKNKGAYSINEKGEVIALALREKGIKEIDFLTHFPHVEKLYLSENKIRDIVALESLVNLTYLGLKDNLVMDVTPIQSLTNLVHLGLKDNKITYIPPDFLTYLPRLEQLFLTGNDIANIPITINLMKSNVLDVLKKHFESQRKKRKKIIIKKDEEVKRANMDAQSNNLDDYFQQASQSFGSNNNNVVLEEPTAYKSDFLPIDFEGKDEIVLPPYTQSLDLSGILIDESIVELSQLSNLTYLKLSSMKLKELSFLAFMQEHETKFEYLEVLDLSNNALASFPAQYLDLMPNLKELYLFGNTLADLPEEVVRVEGNCLRHFKRELNEAKLIVVGVGNVGKSELVEALCTEDYVFTPARNETKGISIKKWKLQEVEKSDFTAHIWDFAGQEINCGTHQFFLTKNSIYVFVWETRNGEKESKFDYWLNIISLLSDNAPIIVVQNKVDIYEDEINQRDWKQRFPNIVEFYKTSCKTGRGIAELRQAITEQLLALPHIGEIWKKDWYVVRTELEQSSKDYITYHEYHTLCEQYNLPTELAKLLCRQLHDIGSILHFEDEINLQDIIILKPNWATDAMYCLFDNKKVIKGRFQISQLDEIWADKRFEGKFSFILNLLERFELIFRLQDRDEYIVPEGLAIHEPQDVLFFNAPTFLCFEYHYDFMPKGIFSRFIVRAHNLISDNIFWRYGALLKYNEDTQALIKLNVVKEILSIVVKGEEADILLQIIRNHINQIHYTLKNPPLKEMIPCICSECRQGRTPYLHNYQTLLRFKEKGETSLVCEKSLEDVSIDALLEGIINLDEVSYPNEE